MKYIKIFSYCYIRWLNSRPENRQREDGNAFAIIGRVSKALRRAGQGDKVAEFQKKATSGDYDNLLMTALEYVDEEDDEDDDDFFRDIEEDEAQQEEENERSFEIEGEDEEE